MLFAVLPPAARELGVSPVRISTIFATSASIWVFASPWWGRQTILRPQTGDAGRAARPRRRWRSWPRPSGRRNRGAAGAAHLSGARRALRVRAFGSGPDQRPGPTSRIDDGRRTAVGWRRSALPPAWEKRRAGRRCGARRLGHQRTALLRRRAGRRQRRPHLAPTARDRAAHVVAPVPQRHVDQRLPSSRRSPPRSKRRGPRPSSRSPSSSGSPACRRRKPRIRRASSSSCSPARGCGAAADRAAAAAIGPHHDDGGRTTRPRRSPRSPVPATPPARAALLGHGLRLVSGYRHGASLDLRTRGQVASVLGGLSVIGNVVGPVIGTSLYETGRSRRTC